jgi:hypothetical protein
MSECSLLMFAAERRLYLAYDPEAFKEAKKIFGDRLKYSSNQYDILDGADALAIITDWSEYRNPEFDRIKSALKSPKIEDGRNLYKTDRMATGGFSYIPLGSCSGGICGEVKKYAHTGNWRIWIRRLAPLRTPPGRRAA